jgi:hypothetical protein
VQCNWYTASARLPGHTADFRYSYDDRSSAAICLPRDRLAVRGDSERARLLLELGSSFGHAGVRVGVVRPAVGAGALITMNDAHVRSWSSDQR